MSEPTTPSLLQQAETIALDKPDGFAAGVTFNGGTLGAEVSGKKDIGKKGGWELGAVARWTKAKGADGAAVIRWTPEK